MLAAVALFSNLPNHHRKEQLGKPFNSENGAQARSFWTLPQVKFSFPRDIIILVVLFFPPHNIYKALAMVPDFYLCHLHTNRDLRCEGWEWSMTETLTSCQG